MEKYLVVDLETTSLSPIYRNDQFNLDARITCICAKASNGQTFAEVDLDEAELIRAFLMWLNNYPSESWVLVTKNGKMFDVPYFQARQKQNESRLGGVYERLTAYRHYDVQEICKGFISLENMATILGLKGKTASGIDAIKMWINTEFAKLKDYCMRDVVVTEDVYLLHNALKSRDIPKVVQFMEQLIAREKLAEAA